MTPFSECQINKNISRKHQKIQFNFKDFDQDHTCVTTLNDNTLRAAVSQVVAEYASEVLFGDQDRDQLMFKRLIELIEEISVGTKTLIDIEKLNSILDKPTWMDTQFKKEFEAQQRNIPTNKFQVTEESSDDKIAHNRIVISERKVFLSNEVGERRRIGLSSADIELTIPLNADPSNYVLVELENATSCVIPKTKSSNPSMMLHQLASLCLARSLDEGEWEFEPTGAYCADIKYYLKGKTYNIDICGVDEESKLKSVRDKDNKRPCLVINKYLLLETSKSQIPELIMMSRLADDRSIKPCVDLNNSYKEFLNCSSAFRKETMEFLISGKDPHQRTLLSHCKVANDLIYEYAIDHINPSARAQLTDAEVAKIITGFRNELDKKITDFTTFKENKFFCFPLKFYDTNQISSEAFAKHVEVKTGEYVIPWSEQISDDAVLTLDNVLRPQDTDDLRMTRKLLERIDSILIHPKAHVAMKKYASQRKLNDLSRIRKINQLLLYYDGAYNLQNAVGSRCSNQVSSHYSSLKNKLFYKYVNYKTSENCNPAIIPEEMLENFSMSTFKMNGFFKIDPDHIALCYEKNCRLALKYLGHSRVYHELRFRSRIVKAISQNYKSGSCFRVNHWWSDEVRAEVAIKGMVFERDKGVAYVSFIYKEFLIRTEKWRLVDIENYKVSHHRLVAFAIVTSKIFENELHYIRYMDYVSTMLTEMSWSVSKFTKAYRFFAYGVLVKNPKLDDCAKKCIEAVSDSNRNRLSMYILSQNIGKYYNDRTPAFQLPFENLSYEIFLVNLGPNKTYGKKKHLSDTIKDLFDEIDLYNNNYQFVEMIFEDFNNLLNDPGDLRTLYQNHMKVIEDLAGKTGGRFTFSPMAIVLISKQIRNRLYHFQDLQEHSPSVNELMTGRASYNPYTGECKIAGSSISAVSQKYSSSSTTLLALKLLTDPFLPSLEYRMFDKAQTGGNREISILSAPFRILQSITEGFYAKVSDLLPNEMLTKDTKMDEFIMKSQSAFQSKGKFFASIDQTRWGPNFNTVMFSYMSAVMLNSTLEAYIPMIVCLIAEFKIFELPPWLTEHYDRVDVKMTLMGKIGRSHMGQGIFHITSSVYHAFSTMVIQSMCNRYLRSIIDLEANFINHIQHSFTTSDDACFIESLNFFNDVRMSEEQQIVSERQIPILQEKISDFYSSYDDILKFFAIKTSSYKNIWSYDSSEFNSQYLAKGVVCKNDIKFLVSLIDPTTTGIFINDIGKSFNLFYVCINSGTSYYCATVVPLLQYVVACRDWNVDLFRVKYPNLLTLQQGIPKTLLIAAMRDHTNLRLAEQSSLHYKTRELEEDIKDNFPDSLVGSLLRMQYSNLQGSRMETGYRAMITHYKGNKVICNSNSLFQTFSAIGATYEFFLKYINSHPDGVYEFFNYNVEEPYLHTLEQKIVKRDLNVVKAVFKRAGSQIFSPFQILVSTEDRVHRLNSTSSAEQYVRHLLRKYWVGELLDERIKIMLLGLTINEQLSIINDEISSLILSKELCISYFSNEDFREKSTTCVKVEYPRGNPITQIEAVFEKILNQKPLPYNYGCSLDYVASIKLDDSFRVRIVRAVGPRPYCHESTSLVKLDALSLDYISELCDERIMELEREFCTEKGIETVYIVMRVDSRKIDKIEQQRHLEELELARQAEEEALEQDNSKEDQVSEDEGEYLTARTFMDMLAKELDIFGEDEDTTNTECTPYGDLYTEIYRKTSEAFVCVKCNLEASVFIDNFNRERAYLNAVLNKMIESNIIRADGYKRGFILNDVRKEICKLTCFDPEIGTKIKMYVSKLLSYYGRRMNEAASEWKSTIGTAAWGMNICDEKGEMYFKLPLLIENRLCFFSDNPKGLELSANEFIELYNKRSDGFYCDT